MAFLLAFAVSLVLTFFLKGKIERPNRFGGLAVLAGLLVSIHWVFGSTAFFTLRTFWFPLGILFVMGVVDDLRPLKPLAKLAVQIAAVGVYLFLSPASSWSWLALSVAFFWLLGVTNAFNLLDNMDGISPGVGAIVAYGLILTDLGADYVTLPLIGALAGFLVFNFHPAKIYLGDSGSHLVGFTLAAMALQGLTLDKLWVPLVIFLVPIADTAFVTVSRLREGRSPFRGGKDHIAHRMVAAGVPVKRTILVFYVVAMGLAFAAFQFWTHGS